MEIKNDAHYDEVVNRMIALETELEALTAAVIEYDRTHNPEPVLSTTGKLTVAWFILRTKWRTLVKVFTRWSPAS
jgi:hypothetical protein